MSWKFRNFVLAVLLPLCLSLIAPASAQGPTKNPNLPKITKPAPRPMVISTTSTTTTTTTTNPPPTSTTPTTTTYATPEICKYGLHMVTTVNGELRAHQEHEFVYTIEGKAMLSVLTTDVESAVYVVNRINQANLIEADFGIGLRAIFVENETMAENLLMQEVQYLQQCETHAIGIFVDYDLYKRAEEIIHELEYNIWPIPSPRALLFPKVAHLLHEMPWGEKIASVEIITDNLDIYNEFMSAVRHERMCLMHFKSDDNVYILFGDKMMANHFKVNDTIFGVVIEPTDREYIKDLPYDAFVLMENEIDVAQNSSNPNSSEEPVIGNTVLPSRVLSLARPLLDMMRWLRGSLMEKCVRIQGRYHFDKCPNFLTFIADWQQPEFRQHHEVADILDLLEMSDLIPLMNFQMYQKQRDEPIAIPSLNNLPIADSKEHYLKREIAAQNFVTNITTYYHYNRANHTSLELKMKFGHVFNCQYSAGDNSRYPFLFDGESVMFWRIKPDAWVATGMTAAILGVIITLAILVFIVVRISLGDVFEGNPVTSILLLLSLVLLFTSFIPFSMEYVGEQRNSHVTFEDVATLNTLCAVRVFIMTLVYCFTFSLLLCRAIMLASIGSEGGFLSHVNGYIQAVICIFSICVQLGMSVQLLVVMHISSESISCENMYYGHWLWALIAYDFVLLVGVVSLVPFIYRSQRNYREGILIVIGAVLTFIIWVVWIVLSFFGDELRDAAIPLGLQATGWAILIGVLIPRTFLIVRGIERSDIAQALPSLTSLAFAQNNQYSSEQSVYECVNPAMRNCSQDDIHQSPSEIPTLPLRGGGPRRQQFFANLRQANANINPQRPPPRPQRGSPTRSSQSSLPDDSPENSKITRF